MIIEPLALRHVSSWPTWFQHIFIAAITIALLASFSSMSPAEGELGLARTRIAELSDLQQQLHRSRDKLSAKIHKARKKLTLKQIHLATKHAGLKANISKTLSNATNIETTGTYPQAQTLVDALLAQDPSWHIKAITLKPSDQGELSIAVTVIEL